MRAKDKPKGLHFMRNIKQRIITHSDTTETRYKLEMKH